MVEGGKWGMESDCRDWRRVDAGDAADAEVIGSHLQMHPGLWGQRTQRGREARPDMGNDLFAVGQGSAVGAVSNWGDNGAGGADRIRSRHAARDWTSGRFPTEGRHFFRKRWVCGHGGSTGSGRRIFGDSAEYPASGASSGPLTSQGIGSIIVLQ